MRLASLVLVLAIPSVSIRADDTPATKTDDPAVRRAVEKSLAYLEKEGLAWWERRKCNGCHHGGSLLLTHQEARQRGFAVDAQKLDAWREQAVKFYAKNIDEHRKKKSGYVEAASLLLSRGESGQQRKLLGELLALGQHADAFWKYEGQPLKRSPGENDEATTLWMILTSKDLDRLDAGVVKGRERALQWIRNTLPGNSTETLVLRTMVENEFGDRDLSKKLLQELKIRQNSDGGWSWTSERPSESFATGQALYALTGMNVPIEDSAIQRARAFLLTRQKGDGSWLSPTRKPNSPDNSIAVYWGTAWATVGLVRTLPPSVN